MFTKVFIFVSLFFVNLSFAALKIDSWTTKEGMKVFFVENHDLPMLDLEVNFRAGSAYDQSSRSGLASMTNHMLFLGSDGITEEEIVNQFAILGAETGSGFDNDKSSFSLRTLSEKKDEAFKLFKTVIHKPNFDQEILEREKQRYISSLKQSDTQPDSIGSKAFMKALYSDHPYGLPNDGDVESIALIEKSMLKNFYNDFYSANGSSMVMVGDISKEDAMKFSSEISQGLPSNGKNSQLPKVNKPQVTELTIPHPSSQAHLFYGFPSIKRGDNDFFPLYVGNYILGGGGFVSRLTGEVREKKGYVYSVYSYFMPMQESGPFQIGLQTKKEQIGPAFDLVKKTVKDFITHGPTEKELKAAKDNMIGGFPMRIDSNKKILSYLSMMAFYDYPLDYLETFSDKVNSVTREEIMEAFQRRVKMDEFSYVIVGAS